MAFYVFGIIITYLSSDFNPLYYRLDDQYLKNYPNIFNHISLETSIQSRNIFTDLQRNGVHMSLKIFFSIMTQIFFLKNFNFNSTIGDQRKWPHLENLKELPRFLGRRHDERLHIVNTQKNSVFLCYYNINIYKSSAF